MPRSAPPKPPEPPAPGQKAGRRRKLPPSDPAFKVAGVRDGKRLLEAFRAGARLTQRQAILSKCADCTCGYADGKLDCGCSRCPLYPYMPYRRRKGAPA